MIYFVLVEMHRLEKSMFVAHAIVFWSVRAHLNVSHVRDQTVSESLIWLHRRWHLPFQRCLECVE